jgi:hypothetical protein
MTEKLNYFIGKVCTIATTAINFRFQVEQMMDYFVGKIDSIDEHGILMTHPTTNCKNYIFIAHIVSITEEQVLYNDNPEHAKIIEEYKKEKPITAEKRKIDSPYVNPSTISEILKKVNS